MPVGFIALLLCISGPSMLIAWLKLRQRNLGPLLDANGWAVNGRVRINVPFGAALTAVAALPPGAKRSLADPYRGKRNPWPAIVIGVILIAVAAWGLNEKGYIFRWTGYGKKVEAAAAEEPSPGVKAAAESKAAAEKADAAAKGDAKAAGK